MDWIERWFGVSPDGGDGTLEILIIMAAVTAAGMVALAVSRRARAAVARLIAGILPGSQKG